MDAELIKYINKISTGSVIRNRDTGDEYIIMKKEDNKLLCMSFENEIYEILFEDFFDYKITRKLNPIDFMNYELIMQRNNLTK